MAATSNARAATLVHRSPIFYGWVVWAVAALGTAATSPGQSYSVSLFFDFFINDFGLDRTTASGLYGLGTFIASLSLTWVGRLVDRYGNRRMNTIISALFALILLAFSLITGPIGLLFGFVAIRGLGQGSLGLVNSTAVAQWFQKRRGRVMSLMMVIMALFQSVYVPWLQGLLETYDWRQVWIILGIGVAATVLPIGWLLMRDKPEDYGLRPDAANPIMTADEIQAEALEENWRLNEALRTPIFWVFSLGRLLMPAWGTGLVLHQISLFGALGHEPIVVAQTFSILALIMAASALAFGYLVDRFRPGVIVAMQMAAMLCALLLAMIMTEAWMLLLYALMFGIAQGSGSVFEGAVWPNLFGRKYIGEIRGFTMMVNVAGSALGPIIFGISFDTLGGYNPILWVGVVWAVVSAVSALLVGKPQRHAPAQLAS